jgi:site-specific DNA-cytosine methylase
MWIIPKTSRFFHFVQATEVSNSDYPSRVVAVEVEAYALANLVAKAEEGKLAIEALWPDLRTFPAERFSGCFDFILAGYPCQPFSHAGKRQGTDDPRHLWPHIARIIEAVRPVWGFFENVPGHLTLGFPEVYRSLRNLHYSVESILVTAAEVGAPHRRQRLFILAHSAEFRCDGLPIGEPGGTPEERGRQESQRGSHKSHRPESGGIDLQSAVNVWPTPQASEHKGQSQRGQHKPGDRLTNMVEHCGLPAPDSPSTNGKSRELLWRTPAAQEPGTSLERLEGELGSRMYDKETGVNRTIGLPQQVNWQAVKCPGGGDKSRSGKRKGELLLGGQVGKGKLNPAWVEQLMGLQVGWTDTSSRVDRLRLLGNGVVSQQAEKAFRNLIRLW